MSMPAETTGLMRPVTRITRKRKVDYRFELMELFRRKELVKYLTISTLKSGHRQLLLGELWWLLEPVLHMLIFVFLVTVIFKRGMPNYAVFVFCAILPFRWFSQSVSQSQGVLTALGGLMRDIAFPKAVYPIALVNSNFVNFLFGFAFLVVLIFFFKIPPTFYWLWMIPLVVQFYIFTLGVSLFLTALSVLFQDLKNIVGFLFQIIFYMSPSLYSPEHVPEKFRAMFALNPFSIVFTSWRDVLMFQRSPDMFGFILFSMMAVVMLVIGFMTFVRLEKVFPKLL